MIKSRILTASVIIFLLTLSVYCEMGLPSAYAHPIVTKVKPATPIQKKPLIKFKVRY